ncbi:hypothetical protein OUZ56_030587 [Daphnia magna]|uniref:Uncharacterized protein n=1 Tax=Daphnia magna TaxID=35525 RepID=A0ABQ9ZRS4_9CRUS|nr:hypothetical protein OUZ56_030587 [Daphnia magna]
MSIITDPVGAQWNTGDGGVKWQLDCDFNGYDIGNREIAGDQCGRLCINTPGCNHFSHFQGVCYLKNAPIGTSRQYKADCVCGYIPGGGGSGGVKGTFWAEQSDAGGCQMPQGDYLVVDAIALGQSQALGNLKWRQGLCGQVLRIDCGNGPVDAVVASTCNLNSDSCGVDMIMCLPLPGVLTSDSRIGTTLKNTGKLIYPTMANEIKVFRNNFGIWVEQKLMGLPNLAQDYLCRC